MIRFDLIHGNGRKKDLSIFKFFRQETDGVCVEKKRQTGRHWFNDDDDDEIRLLKICDAILHRSNLQLLIFNAPLFDDT